MSEASPTRRCRACGERKNIRTGFYANKTRDKRLCRVCARAYGMARGRERGDFLTGYKLDRGCVDCGWNKAAVALQFDHRPGETKLCGVHTFRNMGTWQQMLDEIAKCDVVCANCHAIRTHSRPPAMRDYDLNRSTKAIFGKFHEDRAQEPLFD